jgi:hypothetical protein
MNSLKNGGRGDVRLAVGILDLKSSTKQFKVPQSNSKIHADVL